MEAMAEDEDAEVVDGDAKKAETAAEAGQSTTPVGAAGDAPPVPDVKLPPGQHLTTRSATSTPGTQSPGGSTATPTGVAEKAEKDDKKASKTKLTPEQKAKLMALEEEKEKARAERINSLVKELIIKIRPFVEARNPGDASDPETSAFEKRIRLEAEDLKLESFGVELLHTIGNVYITKSTNYVRSKRFFGGGFLGRLKEKGSMLKEGWGLLGSA